MTTIESLKPKFIINSKRKHDDRKLGVNSNLLETYLIW